MHQHACVANIIGMVVLDLEVVDGDGAFKNLMLNLLDNDILAVAGDKDMSAQSPFCPSIPTRCSKSIPDFKHHVSSVD